jgi:hypothetical protein
MGSTMTERSPRMQAHAGPPCYNRRIVFQRDYILRALGQAAAAIARALRLRAAKKQVEAEQALGEGYAALGLDRELLTMLDADSLRRHFDDEQKLGMAVRLLLCDVELNLDRDRRSALQRLKAARRLLGQLSAADPELAAELERVSDLAASDASPA